ncbi:MAG: glycosyltransferase family 1 protein, partial [Solirubrobacterales bacterium]|nr:glycosyltransferase family 1 protein [Solirubrobacterales bacterium]
MHVGLNLVFLVPGETGGMEVYARELVPRLAALPGLRVTAFVNREAAAEDFGAERVVVPVRATNRLEWVRGEQLLLPGRAERAGVDLVHSLASTAPVRGRFRRVTTIHDLLYKLMPDAHFGVRALGMRVLVPAAARRSHRIVVDAASTKADLVSHLGVEESRVDVVPLAANSRAPAVPTPEGELRERLGLGARPVLLCVGAKRPHKNAARVVDAVAAMPAERRPALVVTGYASPYDDELRRRAGAGDALVLPEWLDAADLEGLYALATAVVVPSLYEGFGLPVLDAMRRGVPVACSDRSSLPEVAGDAAL